QADVFADDRTVRCANRPRRHRQITTEKLSERTLADEADAGGIALCRVRQPDVMRDFPDLGFVQLTDRKQCVRELLLIEPMQKIALILAGVESAHQLISA